MLLPALLDSAAPAEAKADVDPVAHLSDEDVEAFGRELDAIRDRVIADLGEDDAAYIRKVIRAQRTLELGGRAVLLGSLLPPAWLLGTAMLATAKVLDNMEIGHNVMHGQWDWMRDPAIHSSTWEWDNASTSDMWKHGHNFLHHTYTNVIGKDRDVGYTILRMDPKQPWSPFNLGQPLYNLVLSLGFQWGVALYDLELEEAWPRGERAWSSYVKPIGKFLRKGGKQVLKDYVVWPALSGPSAPATFTANLTANVIRNVWTNAVIFCGHFPHEAETFDEEVLEGETRGEWYLRQLLGSANLEGGEAFHVATGNLSRQIEHHLFPDVPSNRYAEVQVEVQELCERYGLPYTTGSLPHQYAQVLTTVWRLALP